MALPGYLRVKSDALLLCVKVQPRSSVNEIGEPLGNELRVKVSAPPVDSAANEALLRLLADALDCWRCPAFLPVKSSRLTREFRERNPNDQSSRTGTMRMRRSVAA